MLISMRTRVVHRARTNGVAQPFGAGLVIVQEAAQHPPLAISEASLARLRKIEPVDTDESEGRSEHDLAEGCDRGTRHSRCPHPSLPPQPRSRGARSGPTSTPNQPTALPLIAPARFADEAPPPALALR
jgi:hypothetical protein